MNITEESITELHLSTLYRECSYDKFHFIETLRENSVTGLFFLLSNKGSSYYLTAYKKADFFYEMKSFKILESILVSCNYQPQELPRQYIFI